MKRIILLVGESASGKDSLAKQLEQDGYKLLKSYATRPKRTPEENTHIFIQPEEVVKYKNKIIAFTQIGAYKYFATIDQVYESDIYIIDPAGVNYFKSKLPSDIKPIVIYINVDEQTRIDRARKRGDNEKVRLQRFIDEFDQFEEFRRKAQFDYSISNYDINKAYKILKYIIEVETNADK